MEISGLKYGNVPSLDVMEMEALLKQCPWFSYLREMMMEKLYRIDEEAFRQKLAESAVFLSSRQTLYDRINAPLEEIPFEEDVEEIIPEPAVFEQPQKPRVVVVGGDFFSKDDLKSISPEDDMELKLRNSPFYRTVEDAPEKREEPVQSAPSKRSSLLTEDGKVNFDDLAFCTETLGHIYAQQGFYDKAIDVFSKLILLYPQKSAYFAALVNDMKMRSAKPSE